MTPFASTVSGVNWKTPIKAGLNFESFLCHLVLTCVPSLGPLPLFVGSTFHQPSWLSVFCTHLASCFCALAHAIIRAGKPSSFTATSPHIIMWTKGFSCYPVRGSPCLDNGFALCDLVSVIHSFWVISFSMVLLGADQNFLLYAYDPVFPPLSG